MVVDGRNERLAKIKRAKQQGKNWDPNEVKLSDLVEHFGLEVFKAGEPGIRLGKEFLRAQRTGSIFKVDESTAGWKALVKLNLQGKVHNLNGSPQRPAACYNAERTRRGALVCGLLQRHGYSVDSQIFYVFREQRFRGILHSINGDEGKVTIRLSNGRFLPNKIAAHDILDKKGNRIMSYERWREVYQPSN